MATTGYIDIPVSGSPSWKPPVTTAAALPLVGNTLGDARAAEDTGAIYVWNGSAWITGDSGSSNSFVIMQTPSGTSPTATSPSDTLTWATSSANLSITGNAGTKTITLGLSGLVTSVTATGPISSTGGTTPNLSISQANSTISGFLSSTDWTTFNNKQTAGNYITALTGDATATGPGNVTLTLATVNSNVGTFGSSTSIPTFTVNAKGLITAASGNAVIAPASTLTGTTLASNVINSSLTTLGLTSAGVVRSTAAGLLSSSELSGDATTSGSNVLTLATVNGSPGTFTNTTITVNGKGLITSASSGTTPVTSVTASSPLTSSGGTTPNISFSNQSANTILAGPTTGAAAAPTFRALVTADLPNLFTVSSKSTNFTAANNNIYLINTGSAVSVQLPAPVSGFIAILKDSTGTANTNNITLVRNRTESIEGIATSKVLQTNWGSWMIISDGTNYFLI